MAMARSSRNKGQDPSLTPDVSEEFFGKLRAGDHQGALGAMRSGRVDMQDSPTNLMCEIAGGWVKTRKEVYRTLFLELLQHDPAMDCMVGGVAALGSPSHLTVALVKDASFSMAKAALMHGAQLGPARQHTMVMATLALMKPRTNVYGHIGMALRRNPKMQAPAIVQQFDLSEHRKLSPTLDKFIRDRDDGATLLSASLTNTMGDEVAMAFMRMIEAADKGQWLLGRIYQPSDISWAAYFNAPQLLAFLLEKESVGWGDITMRNVGLNHGLTAVHVAARSEKLALDVLSNWAVKRGHDLRNATDKWERSIYHTEWQAAKVPHLTIRPIETRSTSFISVFCFFFERVFS
jgi:hypothetical protein